MEIDLGTLGNVAGIVGLIAATVALIRQRKSDERQMRADAEQKHRELRLRQHDALILQQQVIARTDSTLYQLMQLHEQGEGLLKSSLSSNDRTYVQERVAALSAQVKSYHDAQATNSATLLALASQEYLEGKTMEDLDRMVQKLSAIVENLDSGIAATLRATKDRFGALP